MMCDSIEDDELSSSIGHHGAYIWETKRILELYIETQSYDAVREAVIEENLLRKSSDAYRERILSEIARRYEIDKNGYAETPLIRICKQVRSDSIHEWVLYYEFSREPVVMLLTTEFLYPKFHSGALSIDQQDVIEFLENVKSDYPSIREWSSKTLERVARHYLAALKDFDILEGSHQKEFKYVFIPDELVLYVLYSLFERDITTADAVVSHREWKLLLMDEDDVRQRLHHLSPTHVQYEKRGSVERLTPEYDSLLECVDAF